MFRCLFPCLFFLLLAACSEKPPHFFSTGISGTQFGSRLALTDHDGRQRQLTDFRGKAVVLIFGYTSCPDVCPTALAKFAEVMKTLGPEAEKVQVLFVTLDPERDSRERLKDFVPWFYPAFLGLYGDRAATDAVVKEFRVHSARKEVRGGLGYVLDHSAGSYVFDPAGRLRLYMRDTAGVEEVVGDLRLLLAGR